MTSVSGVSGCPAGRNYKPLAWIGSVPVLGLAHS